MCHLIFALLLAYAASLHLPAHPTHASLAHAADPILYSYFNNEIKNISNLNNQIQTNLTNTDSNKYSWLISQLQLLDNDLSSLQAVLISNKLPINSISPLCPGVTTFNRQQIGKPVSKLELDSGSVSNYLDSCFECNSFNASLHKLTNLTLSFVGLTNSTLDGKYCSFSQVKEQATGMVNLNNSFFKNNLKSKNWYYGSTTPSDYKIAIFKKAALFNLTDCPLSSPFVNQSSQACINCPDGSLFNLGTSLCDSCNPGEILNIKTGNCDKCEGEKHFEVDHLVCYPCKLSEGKLFNSTSGKCYTCNTKSYLDRKNGVCVEINCDGSTPRFNSTTLSCEACPSGSTIDPNDYTKCTKTNYIGICPPQTPYYDSMLKGCTVCPKGTSFDNNSQFCISNSHKAQI